jgi:hypothetical protein
MGQYEYGEPCSGGCGKKVLNRLGICRECNTMSCSKCNKKYVRTLRTINSNLCTKCHRSISAAQNRDARIMELGGYAE